MTDEISENQHAYIVCGDPAFSKDFLRNAIEKNFGVKISGNPDYRENDYDSLGIDEARRLKEDAGRMAFSGEHKFFIISAGALTREAQNALLKVFEEPSSGTYIFLLVPAIRQIIPTLLSRARVVKIKNEKLKIKNSEAETFLKNSPEKRLSMPVVKKMLEDKDKQAVISFFNEIEIIFSEKVSSKEMTPETADFLKELIKSRGYAGDRAPSVKMLLEHAALIAPVIK